MIEPTPSDPTGTDEIIGQMRDEFDRRWRRVHMDIERQIRGPLSPNSGSQAELVSQFRHEIEQSAEQHIVEPMSPAEVINGQHYSAVFIRDAYRQGIEVAEYYMQEMGMDIVSRSNADFDRETDDIMQEDQHQERLEDHYVATYSDIEDAEEETQTDTSRNYRNMLAAGIPLAWYLRGRSDSDDGIIDRIEKVGGHATDLITSNRLVETTNDAALQRYADGGLTSVTAEIELDMQVEIQDIPGEDLMEAEWEKDWVTAGDDRVCLECWGLAADGPYEITEIRENQDVLMPPLHPNCRCVITPSPARLRR